MNQVNKVKPKGFLNKFNENFNNLSLGETSLYASTHITPRLNKIKELKEKLNKKFDDFKEESALVMLKKQIDDIDDLKEKTFYFKDKFIEKASEEFNNLALPRLSNIKKQISSMNSIINNYSTQLKVFEQHLKDNINNDFKFNSAVNTSQIFFGKLKKIQSRKGDWVCTNCKNLNFAFRIFCNRCCCNKSY